MKKLFTLLTLLVATVTCAWAQGTYGLQTGGSDFASGTQVTSVPNMTMTYGVTGGLDFKTPKADNTLASVLGANGFTEGNTKNGKIGEGTVYFFEPTANGTLTVGFVLNSGKNFWVKTTDDEQDVEFISFTNASGEEVKNADDNTFKSGDKVAAKLTGGLVTFSVVSGKKYAVFCTGSKLGYYGFKFAVTSFNVTPAYDKSTYVAPAALDFSAVSPAGLKAYVATAAASGSVTLDEVTTVPAGTPLLLIGTAGTEYTVPVAASASAPATNLLAAGDGTTAFDGSSFDYILASDGLFHQISSGTVAEGKAYLHCASNPTASAPYLTLNFGDVTGINEVQSAGAKVNGYFDLLGRKVAQPTKGLYIVNGKKVVIK